MKQKKGIFDVFFEYNRTFFLARKTLNTTLKPEETKTVLHSFYGLFQPSLQPCKCLPICLRKQLLIAFKTKVSNWRGVSQILDITNHVENPFKTLTIGPQFRCKISSSIFNFQRYNAPPCMRDHFFRPVNLVIFDQTSFISPFLMVQQFTIALLLLHY